MAPCAGGWFVYVSCPHFTAEILIYAGLVILNGGGINACLLLAWTVSLSILCKSLVFQPASFSATLTDGDMT